MKNKNKLFSALLIVFTLALSSCSQRLIDFTIISSKNHSIRFDKSKGKRVEGKSMGFLGIGIDIKDAMDNALQSAGSKYDILLDGVVKAVQYPFVSGFKVEGTAYSSTELKAMLGEKGFDEWCDANNVYVTPNKASN